MGQKMGLCQVNFHKQFISYQAMPLSLHFVCQYKALLYSTGELSESLLSSKSEQGLIENLREELKTLKVSNVYCR